MIALENNVLKTWLHSQPCIKGSHLWNKEKVTTWTGLAVLSETHMYGTHSY
jgi:hypothetical protein